MSLLATSTRPRPYMEQPATLPHSKKIGELILNELNEYLGFTRRSLALQLKHNHHTFPRLDTDILGRNLFHFDCLRPQKISHRIGLSRSLAGQLFRPEAHQTRTQNTQLVCSTCSTFSPIFIKITFRGNSLQNLS